jgi:hypothetical protein
MKFSKDHVISHLFWTQLMTSALGPVGTMMHTLFVCRAAAMAAAYHPTPLWATIPVMPNIQICNIL